MNDIATATTSNNTVTSAIELHITQCVTLIQSVFRRWRDKRLIMNSYAQFEDLCKEVEHNINASLKLGFQQYRTEVSLPAVGRVQIDDVMNGMKLFVNRDIFSPYAFTARSSLLHRQKHQLLQRSQPPHLNEIRKLPSSFVEKLTPHPSSQPIKPRNVFDLTSIEGSTSCHEEDVLMDACIVFIL